MKNIRLHHPFSNNMTAVSNYFIDYYMPQAGGEYVKLYLCLLRHAADYGSIPLESIAELFDYTERDIYRALQYWADQLHFCLHLDWLSAVLRQRGTGWIKRCSAPLMAAVRLAFSHLSAFPQPLAVLGRS